MFLFLQSINCFYLFHNRTQKFLGEVTPNESKIKFTTHNYPEPINGIEKAIDFKLGTTKDPKGMNVTIEHPTNGRAFDMEGGGNVTGAPLIFFGTHRLQAQQFQLLLLADNSFVIGHQDKCVKYNDAKNGFFLQKCEDLKDSTFDIYYEVAPTPEYFKEQTFNLDNKENEDPERDESIKSTNPFIDGQGRRVITEITFKNGKAIAKTPVDKDITGIVNFDHYPVKVHKKDQMVRHISRRRKHDDTDSCGDKTSKNCQIGELISDICDSEDSSSDRYSYSSDSDLDETHKRVRRERLLHGKPTKSHGMAKVARKGIYV